MGDEVIQRTYSMKYLGCIINPTLKIDSHLVERARLAYAASSDLYYSDEFEKNLVSGLIKSDQYKTYIRPILTYGTEIFENSPAITDHIRHVEMNIIKRANQILTRTKNRLFLKAIKMQSIEDRLEVNQLAFIARFMQHEYCNQFVINLFQHNAKRHHLSVFYSYMSTNEISERIPVRLMALNKKKLADRTQTALSNRLNLLLENPIENQNKIFNILRVF